MSYVSHLPPSDVREERDSLGQVEVPGTALWGVQTQQSLEHFSVGHDLMSREMVSAYAILKKAAATANHAGGRLDDGRHRLIVQGCDEILAGAHTPRQLRNSDLGDERVREAADLGYDAEKLASTNVASRPHAKMHNGDREAATRGRGALSIGLGEPLINL
jgi:hypothetical protein